MSRLPTLKNGKTAAQRRASRQNENLGALRETQAWHRSHALRAERDLDWRTAYEHWAMAGEHEKAECCRYIAEACEKGDRYRARVRALVAEGLGRKMDDIYRQASVEVYGHA